jgi:hypothetical protein
MSRYDPPPLPPPAEVAAAAARKRALLWCTLAPPRRRRRSRRGAAEETDAALEAAIVCGGLLSIRTEVGECAGVEEEECGGGEKPKRERGVGPVSADVALSKWRRLW